MTSPIVRDLPAPSRLPVAFRAPRRVKLANVLATAFAMAAGACFVLSHLLQHALGNRWAGSICAITTLFFGLAWGTLLRCCRTRAAMAWSIPLAAANASLGYLSVAYSSNTPKVFWDHFRGNVEPLIFIWTFASVLWIPALLLCWLAFGFPLHRAKIAAERGLGGEDAGERTVSLAAIAVAIGAVACSLLWPFEPEGALVFVLGALSLVLAGGSAIVSTRREDARRRFVSEVKAGHREDYRVERKPSGREVLLRVQMSSEGYRVAPRHEEEVVELDADGDAVRAV